MNTAVTGQQRRGADAGQRLQVPLAVHVEVNPGHPLRERDRGHRAVSVDLHRLAQSVRLDDNAVGGQLAGDHRPAVRGLNNLYGPVPVEEIAASSEKLAQLTGRLW